MVNYKISSILIAILIVGFVIGSFSVVTIQFHDSYNSDNDNIDLSSLNKMQEVNNNTQQIKDSIKQIETNENWLSKLDGFFSAGWGSVKMAGNSADVTTSLINDGLEEANIGFIGTHLKTLLTGVIIIIIFIAILLSVIIKKDL